MVLSLIMLSAVVQIFLSSERTYSLSNDMSRIQENGRFSLDFMTQAIRLGGYQGEKGDSLPYLLDTACGGFDPCTSNGGGTDSDRIAVYLNPAPDDGTETDCTGANVGANDEIANVYYITITNGISSLTCRGFNVTNNGWNAAEQPLIDGIENMQVQYGIDTTGTGVSRFVSAESVADWTQIRAIRLGLLVNSGDQTGSGDETQRRYVVLDGGELAFNDRHIRQIYTTTISLPNFSL
jgi:type IV pilus assembly protein PilW